MITYRKYLRLKAKENRRSMNKIEARLWYDVLSNRKMLGFRFLRQKPLSNYIVDFYCHELKMVVEVDGRSHDDQMEYDIKRTIDLEEVGLIVIRYTNLEVMQQLDGVYLDLKDRIEIRARELKKTNPSTH